MCVPDTNTHAFTTHRDVDRCYIRLPSWLLPPYCNYSPGMRMLARKTGGCD